MTELAKSLQRCRVEGNTLYLPSKEEGMIENYQDVRNALMKAGAIYKRNTFVFKSDAAPLVDRLIGGQSVNIQKEFQFFETPAHIAEKVVKLAQIDLKDEPMICEPSAGSGAFLQAIKVLHKAYPVYCYELMPENQALLSKIPEAMILGDDWMTHHTIDFDYIIANPPFTKDQDIKHFMKMYDHCLGTITCIMSMGWMYRTTGEAPKFRKWLDDRNLIHTKEWMEFSSSDNKRTVKTWPRKNGEDVFIEKIPAGEFKESGTSIATCIVKLTKKIHQ